MLRQAHKGRTERLDFLEAGAVGSRGNLGCVAAQNAVGAGCLVRHKFCHALCQLLVRYFQLKLAARDVDVDDIAVTDNAYGAAVGSLRRNMAYGSTVGAA